MNSLTRTRSQLLQLHITAVAPWCDQEAVIKLHHVVSHLTAQSCSATLPEEQSSGKTELHVSEMDTKTHPRTASERHVRSFLLSRELRFIHEAAAIEAVKHVRYVYPIMKPKLPTEAALGRF
jgi:hypothetical protein